MKTVTVKQFNEAMKAQGRARIEDVTFKCPRCGTLQSAQDLIDAGAGKDMDEVEKYLAYSCVGRFTKLKGCDWTLGGLFQIHQYEVIDDAGNHHPRFEPTTESEQQEGGEPCSIG